MTIRRLLILFWLPTLAFGQQSFYGTRASSIHLSEGANPADLERIPIHAGEVIQPENVRAAIQALFETGSYRSVEVDAVASGNGTDLTFNVTPHYFFSTFRLEPENLLDRPLSSLIRLPFGQKFTETQVREIAEQTKQILQDAGYMDLTLTTVIGPDNDLHLRTVDLQARVGPKARIGEIVIQGGQGALSSKEIRDALHVSSGDSYSLSEIDKGLTAIRRKLLNKNFINTQVDANREYDAATNTVRLTVKIDTGQKIVIEILNTGHNQISEDEIRNLVPVFEEGEVDPGLMREGRAHIIEYLQQKGYFETKVAEPKITPSTDGGPVRISFSIDTGEQHTVKSVQFHGNTVFSDKEIQERIKIHPASSLTFLNHGLFSDELAKSDVVTIQNMYRRAGYEAAFVEARQPGDNPKHEIDVVFDITENAQYAIERIVFTGNANIPEADLRAAITLREGGPYSPAEAEDAATKLTALYYKMGYPDVRVEAAADRNPETGNRLLTYLISEGRRYQIVQILIAGNTHTSTKVIKRASGLSEYAWFDPENILSAQQKLYATGLFRHVDIVSLDNNASEQRTLLIQVEEAKHIVVTPGVGVKEYAGPRVLLDISHNNLFGLNQQLGFRGRWGVKEQEFQLNYRQPRLFNHDDLAGFGAFTLDEQNQVFYEASNVELALQVRKQLSAIRSLLLTASYETVDLKNIKLNPIVRAAPEPLGVVQIARIGTSFISDTRDDVLNPKRGVFSTSTFQVANTALGSEVNFVSLFHQSTFQRKAGLGTLAYAARVGWKVPYGGTPELPITERYFAGGSTTLRGFGLDEAGPPGGGQLLTIGNVEYRFPLKTFSIGQLGGAAFYDTGNVFERPSDFALKDFTHSAGWGLRFLTPLGPVRFDMGFNLNPKIRIQGDGTPVREGVMHVFFTLGHMF